MWTLLLLQLVTVLFAGGAAIALAGYFLGGKDRRPGLATLAAVPVGCVGLPFVGLAVLAGVGAFLQKSDMQLYEEIFGYRPSVTEDRMLFDDFGSGTNREIFMRIEPSDQERRRLMAIPGLVPSDLTLDQFIARGAQHGFSWWISSEILYTGYCRSARIQDAPGFRGWIEFRVAECLDAGEEFPASANAGRIYVVASRRAD